MAAGERAHAITHSETAGSIRLWIAAVGGAFSWFAHLVANYSLEEWFACSSATVEQGLILGFDVKTVSLALNLLFLATAIASTVIAFLCWRRSSAEATTDESARARWMARASLIADLMFVAIIVWGFAPPALLGICEYAP